MNAASIAMLAASGLAAGTGAYQAVRLAFDPHARFLASRLERRARLWRSGHGGGGRLKDALDRFKEGKTFGSILDRWARARERREIEGKCLDELPELIDVLALGLSAGVSFDASLAIYCERYDTMLARRLSRAMESWQLGFKSRREALDDLAAELRVGSFTTFVNTVNEALVFGAPLSSALIEQGDAVRERRRSDLEERIEKAPVKMIIPITTMILPAMLIAIVGPLFSSFMGATFG